MSCDQKLINIFPRSENNMTKKQPETVFLLSLLHDEEGEQDPKGVFSSKAKLNGAVEKLKSELDNKELEEEVDYRIDEVPFDEV